VLAAVTMIDDLDRQIAEIDVELRRLGADHPYVPPLMSIPGVAWVLGYTIAAEIGDIGRFASPAKLCGDTDLCPRVYQSGATDRRGPLTHAGPRYLRWALMEAATHACRHPLYRHATCVPSGASAANAAPRSPRWTSPGVWPRRSGRCSPATSPSLRQAPRALWPHRRP
jgi:transposase